MITFQTIEYRNGEKVYHATLAIAVAYMKSRNAITGGLIELFDIIDGQSFYRDCTA